MKLHEFQAKARIQVDLRYAANGYVGEYPHNDIDGPCTGACCFPECFGPYPFRCTCGVQLRWRGLCIECAQRAGTVNVDLLNATQRHEAAHAGYMKQCEHDAYLYECDRDDQE